MVFDIILFVKEKGSIMERIIDRARSIYERDKEFLRMPQKILFKKYMYVLNKYSKLCDKYSLEYSLVMDDLIIMDNLYKIHRILRYSSDNNYVLDIDKNKLNTAKTAVNDEIKRISIIIKNILELKEETCSNYTTEQVKEYLGHCADIDELIELNLKIKTRNKKVVFINPNKKVLSKKKTKTKIIDISERKKDLV